jgi:hypothetical protein
MRRRGNCYVACEALYHLFAKNAGFRPYWFKWRGDTHWILGKRILLYDYSDPRLSGKREAERFKLDVIDPCIQQWRKADRPGPEDYATARCSGFLTVKPSKRASALMEKLIWQTLRSPARRS